MLAWDRESLEAAKTWAQEHLDNDLIIGYGISDNVLCIYLTSEDPELMRTTEIDGVPVQFCLCGPIIAS